MESEVELMLGATDAFSLGPGIFEDTVTGFRRGSITRTQTPLPRVRVTLAGPGLCSPQPMGGPGAFPGRNTEHTAFCAGLRTEVGCVTGICLVLDQFL